MNTKKILILFMTLLTIGRSIILMRRKEYREFPLYFLLFSVGASTLVRGIRRFLESDTGFLPGGRFGPQAWYQDIAGGVCLALMGLAGCAAYIEIKANNKKTQSDMEEPPTKDESSDSASSHHNTLHK